MINSIEIIRSFEDFFKKMSYEERESYLKDMGFSYGVSEKSPKSYKPTQAICYSVKSCSHSPYIAANSKRTIKKAREIIRVAKSKA